LFIASLTQAYAGGVSIPPTHGLARARTGR
jgi:hypothetical protein